MRDPATDEQLPGASEANGPQDDRQSDRSVPLLFDAEFYGQLSGLGADGQLSAEQLFDHWKTVGRFKNLDPHPLFCLDVYNSQHDAREFESIDQITHYCERTNSAKLSTHPAFDPEWYLKTYADVRHAGTNPLLHYLSFGHGEGRRPSPVFDGNWYLAEYPDVAAAGMNPLVHYVRFGNTEGRFRNRSESEALSKSKYGGMRSRRIGSSSARLVEEADTQVQFDPQPGPPLKFLAKRLASAKLLSLDVWDTVLYRRCHPDEIKIASARLLFVCYPFRLKHAFRDVLALYRARRIAEDEASLTDDFEYRFEDAALRWVETVFETGTPKTMLKAVVEQLLRHELAAEIRAAYANQSIFDLLAADKHPPLIFVSDFYLSGALMTELLQNKGFRTNFVKLFCSSDYATNKRSGGLFDHVSQEFAVNPSEILHIGDNYRADVEVPRAKGIETHHYRSPAHESERLENEKLLNARLALNLMPMNVALSSLLRGNAQKRYEEPMDAGHKALRRLGYRIAPLAIGLVLHVIERAKMHGLAKVFFFTREGIFLKALYEAVVKHDPYGCTYPEPILLDVSRIATFGPSIKEWNEKSFMRIWTLYSIQSPAAFVRSLDLDESVARSLFAESSIDFEAPLTYPWLNQEFMAVINGAAFREFAGQSIAARRDLLSAYLTQQGFDLDAKFNLVVDVGWRGSIQDNLAEIFPGHLHGCYLGLFQFLNAQTANSSKSAWLFDFNVAKPDFLDIEVAPIEMLFNSLGGSVTGYSRNIDGVIESQKRPIETEDRAYLDATRWIQAGIFDAVADVADFVRIRGLVADDLAHSGWNAFRSLLKTPSKEFAAAFFGLSHNEIFGTGELYSKDPVSEILKSIETLKGPLLHSKVLSLLEETRWSDGLSALPVIRDALDRDPAAARHLPSVVMRSCLGKRSLKGTPRVGFMIPAPIVGSGGHRTIFKIARQFALRGCEVFCFLEGEGDGIAVAKEMLGDVESYVFVGWDKAASLDVAFATIAHSASFVANMPNVKLKCYLVQDYEALFNPIGDYYTIAENSYMHGLRHFTIGNWLTNVLANQHGATGIPAGLGIDMSTYFVKPKNSRETAICFLYQPEKPRRNCLLGIEAIRLVKRRFPSIKVYVYGSDAQFDLDFEVERLGLIRDLIQLNELYNRCSIGLCISMSNPSRIPFEMMACGTVPIDVYRYNNLFDYETGTVLLAHQSPQSMAHAMTLLLQDSTLLRKHRQRCVRFARGRTATWEADVVVNSVFQELDGHVSAGERVRVAYTDAPIVAPVDDTDQVAAFCQWQRRLADASIQQSAPRLAVLNEYKQRDSL